MPAAPMPSVAIDMRMLESSGIGTYLENLTPLILRNFPGTRFHLMGSKKVLTRRDWTDYPNVSLVAFDAPIYSVREQVELARNIPEQARVFWSPHYNIPLAWRRGRLLVTVHDVFHLAMSQYVKGLEKKLYAKAMFAALRRKASAILMNSDFTRREFVRWTGGDHPRMVITPLGVRPERYRRHGSARPSDRPYFLFIGNVKPHKNLRTLLAAFELLTETIPHDLVIIGKQEGFLTGDTEIAQQAERLGGRVRFTGYADHEALCRYLAHADGLVLPSLYEGFGLPPLEAMACGCPVIVSTAASLPEVCGEAALYCDPHSAEDLAARMRELAENSALRDALREKGYERIRHFTWDRCAEQTGAVLEGLLREQ